MVLRKIFSSLLENLHFILTLRLALLKRDFLPTDKSSGVYFFDDLEEYNLKLVPKGTHFGFLFGEKYQVKSLTEFDEDIFYKYFEIIDNKIFV